MPSYRRRSTSLFTPRARRVLIPQPFQNVQAPLPRRRYTSPPIPRARRVLITHPLQNLQVPSRRIRTSPLIPRAGRVLTTQPLQNLQVPSLRRRCTSPFIPRARRVLIPHPFQNLQVPSRRRRLRTILSIPRARRVLCSQKLQDVQVAFLGGTPRRFGREQVRSLLREGERGQKRERHPLQGLHPRSSFTPGGLNSCHRAARALQDRALPHPVPRFLLRFSFVRSQTSFSVAEISDFSVVRFRIAKARKRHREERGGKRSKGAGA